MPSQATKSLVYEGKRVKIYSNIYYLGVEKKELDISPELDRREHDSGTQYGETIYPIFKFNPQHESPQQDTQAPKPPSGVASLSYFGEEETAFVNLLLPTIQESLSLGKFASTGSCAGLTSSSLTWNEVELPESLFIESQSIDIKKFADFFVGLASKIPEVLRILAETEQNMIDIYTIFDSEDEKTYDSIYEAQRATFFRFPDVCADFHTINLRDFGEGSLNRLISSTSPPLFSRS